MDQSAPPTKPVKNWEQVRDEWVAAVEQLVGETEAWAQAQGWATRRDPKTATEYRLGAYTVPQLLIHAPAGRLILDPIARYVPGALGVVEFCALPSYDSMRLGRTADGWFLQPDGEGETPRPWSEAIFRETSLRLLESAK
jgi:hypothetical protein